MNEPVHFGPAKVVSVDADGRARVQLLSGSCAATAADWALPFRYEPCPGDLLQVIGQGARFWVTGVLHGRGTSRVAFVGDAELRAAGALALHAGGGLRIDSPQVDIEAQELSSEVAAAVSRLGELDATVRAAIDERAGACEQTVDGDDHRLAARHETVAAKVVKVDGSLLRLS